MNILFTHFYTSILADVSSTNGIALCNPLNVNSIQDLLYLVVSIGMYIGMILAVLAFIWSGFRFIAAQGNSDKLTEARQFFYAVVIGTAILLGATLIVNILKNTLTSAGVVNSGVFGGTSSSPSASNCGSTAAPVSSAPVQQSPAPVIAAPSSNPVVPAAPTPSTGTFEGGGGSFGGAGAGSDF